jgi:hypothetical protein
MRIGIAIAFACTWLALACSSSGGGASPAKCSNSGAATCQGGATVQECITTDSNGTCASTYYTVGSQTFECSSCEDTSCAQKATAACLSGPGGGPDGGSPTGPGSGAACTTSQTCPTLACSCSSGSSTSYQGCINGACATSCPSPNGAAGAACIVPGGCFCASGTCGFGAETCCASAGATPSGSSCVTDCDCQSGNCTAGQCF